MSFWQYAWHDQEPGPLGDNDVASFHEASDRRKMPRNYEQVKRRLRELNWVRMRRLRKDYKWLQKQLIKMGINPEDAHRWIL